MTHREHETRRIGYRAAVERCGLLATLAMTLVTANLPLQAQSTSNDTKDRHRSRRPVALSLSPSGDRLLVANRNGGSLSRIDTRRRIVLWERVVGEQLSDVCRIPGRDRALVLDEARHELLVVDDRDDGLNVVSRLPVERYPVEVVCSADGRRGWVASLWSRRVTMINLEDPRRPRVIAVASLDFAPRKMTLSPDERALVVADSFGGRLAVLDSADGRLLGARRIDGHNIRGMTLSGDGTKLLLSHQRLSADYGTTRGSVHWGDVMSNVIRAVPFRDVLTSAGDEADEDEARIGDVYFLGYPDQATGDPADLVETADRRRIVVQAGVSRLAVSDSGGNYFHPLTTGAGPTALAVDPSRNLVYVACRFDDSITVATIDPPEVVGSVSLGPRREPTAIERGEALFHDATLASDGWYSCHSCHTDGHTNHQRNDNLSDGSIGAAKRVLSLLGVGATGPWTWLGEADDLPAQVRKSVEVTMQGAPLSDRQVEDLVAYVRRLPPAPSLASARDRSDDETTRRGEQVFLEHGCADCHVPPLYTSPDAYDVGLVDEQGNRRFNPPSLRGVSQRDRLLHDGRASSVREVVEQLRHGQQTPVSDDDLPALLRFLESI